MTRLAVRRTPLAGRLALAVCALALAGFAAGCSDVKEGLEDADKTLSGALVDTEEAEQADGLTGPALTEAIYEGGLKLKAEKRAMKERTEQIAREIRPCQPAFHRVNQIEGVKIADECQHTDNADRRQNQRELDAPEYAPSRRAINARRLD